MCVCVCVCVCGARQFRNYPIMHVWYGMHSAESEGTEHKQQFAGQICDMKVNWFIVVLTLMECFGWFDNYNH